MTKNTEEDFLKTIKQLFSDPQRKAKKTNQHQLTLDNRFAIDGDGNIDGVIIYLGRIETDVTMLDRLREYLADKVDEFFCSYI